VPQPRSSLARFVGAFGVLVVLAAVANVALVAAVEAENDRVDGLSNDVLQPAALAVEQWRTAMVDQETGVRGYVLTNDEQFLESYRAGQASEPGLQSQIDEAVSSTPAISEALAGVVSARETWVREVAELEIALMEAGQIDEAVSFVASGQGKERFDRVRDAFDDLQLAIVTEIDDQRESASARSATLRMVSVITAAALAVAVVGAVIGLRLGYVPALRRLAGDIDRVADGELEHPITVQGPGELSSIGQSVEVMRQRMLTSVNRRVEARIVLAQEEQRRQIARGVHDDSLQSLTVVMLGLARLRRSIDPDQVEHVRELEVELASAAERLRSLLFELHPPGLEGGRVGLAATQLVQRVLEPAGVAIDDAVDHDAVTSEITSIVAYRLLREAVVNVARHAQATTASLVVEVNDSEVHVAVTDDGIGSTRDTLLERAAGHLGLTVVLDLVEAVGGRWNVSTGPDGTRVEAWVPDGALAG
jgi:signal transduction histidine kinase